MLSGGNLQRSSHCHKRGLEPSVRVNGELTLDFDNADSFELHHYAFHVSDEEFDAIFKRVQEAGIPWGSDPWSRENRQLNSRKGGRGVYFCDPNGHVLELLTRA